MDIAMKVIDTETACFHSSFIYLMNICWGLLCIGPVGEHFVVIRTVVKAHGGVRLLKGKWSLSSETSRERVLGGDCSRTGFSLVDRVGEGHFRMSQCRGKDLLQES